MAQAAIITIDELRQVSRPSRVGPTQLEKLTERVNAMAARVQNQWDDLSGEERETLTAFAYTGFQQHRLGIMTSVYRLVGRSWYALMMLRGQEKPTARYIMAMAGLIEAIFDGIERSSAEYRTAVEEALSEAHSLFAAGRMPPEVTDAHDWVSRVSREAVTDV